MNVKKYYSSFYGYKIRKNLSKVKVKNEDQIVLILGDSISDGYGHAYQDIWWKQLERMLKIKNKDFNFISISGYGNNLFDSRNNIKDIIKKLSNLEDKTHTLKKVIYQFNFNDIYPFNREDLRKKRFSNSILKEIIYIESINLWRYEHLNKSIFARVMQHYAGIFIRKTDGSCNERGFDALGLYSWTFGSKYAEKEAKNYWDDFQSNLYYISRFLRENNIEFEVVLAPIVFQIDQTGVHPYYNPLNFDFDCATINPIIKIKKITSEKNIKVYDPTGYIRSIFNELVLEDNFKPFFFTADTNHFTPVTSQYIAEFMAKHW